MLRLNTIEEIKLSGQPIPCDALIMLYDFMRASDVKENQKHITYLMTHKLDKIQPNEQYFHIEVYEDQTGEVFEFNCKKNIHQYNLDKNIYPKHLTKIFK